MTPTPSPLISAAELQSLLDGGAELQLFDCGFDLAAPDAGQAAFRAAHLPGARYLHLERHLCGPRTGGNGRHPLPGREAFAATLGAQGLRDDLPVVAMDGSGGMYAARLWWMLRWVGHPRVQVLDGGLAAWRAAGGALQAGDPPPAVPARFTLRPARVRTVDFDALRAGLGAGGPLIVDARGSDRFRGENETLDPVGGHIPGAVNRPFRDNLAADGRFKPADALRADWLAVLAGRAAEQSVAQCGSGVTACHNLLAMAVAGLDGASLYPGSWSEWCARDNAPVATGAS